MEVNLGLGLGIDIGTNINIGTSTNNGITDTCPNALANNSLMVFMALINSLYADKCNFLYPPNFPKDRSGDLKDGMDFDYIVVGAGAAGSVVANRLSENQTHTVLLLEAGSYPPVDTQIPGFATLNLGNPEIDWTYYMEKSNNSCLSFKNGSCLLHRGKMLGGTSSLNGMFYIRGNPRDYNEWAAIANKSSWRWSRVRNFFRKSENIQYPPLQSSDLHGTEGLMQTTRYSMKSPLTSLLKNTYKELGYKEGIDERQIGYFKTLLTVDRDGRRESTAKAFLSDAEEYKDGRYPNKRTNLFLSLKSLATKVIIENRVTKGVKVLVNGKEIHVFAKKKVILSCGAIKTPQLLMLSGIGPKEELQKFNIPQVVNLHVGRGLKDHYCVWGIGVQVNNSIIPQKSKQENLADIFEYFNNGTGKLAVPPTNNILLFNDPYKNSTKNATIQWIVQPFTANDSMLPISMGKANMDPTQFSGVLEQNVNQSFFCLIPTLLSPKSRGVIKLASTNPLDNPLIYPNYLSDRRDVDALLAGIRFVRSMLDTQAMRKASARFLRYGLKNCDHLEVDSDEHWECIIRNTGTSMHDPVGTCKMAPRRKRGVVDGSLRVHGVKNLRVVDGSIMPTIPRGSNTNAPTIMIGELGAFFIQSSDSN